MRRKLKILEPSQAPKVVNTDSSIKLEEHVKFYHGITALQRFIDPRQKASLKEPSDERKKPHQRYCSSQDWMKGCGQIQDSSSTSPETERSDGHAPGNLAEEHQKQKKKRRMTVEMRTTVHRQSRGHTDACARTLFSGLRFGTPTESGVKIKEAQYFHSLPQKPKLRSMLANQNYEGSLQKAH